MSTLSIAGLIAVWGAIIQAGFQTGIADGTWGAKCAFIIAIVGLIAGLRPNSTKAWLEGLNR